MSFCNQTLNVSSLSLVFTPSSSRLSTCCNFTIIPTSRSEQMTINLLNLSTISPSLKLFDAQMKLITFENYTSASNRLTWKSSLVQHPLSVSLCQFDLPPFEILLSTLSRGKSMSGRRWRRRGDSDLIQVLANPVNTDVCSAIKNNGVLIRPTIATGINLVLKAPTKPIVPVRCSSLEAGPPFSFVRRIDIAISLHQVPTNDSGWNCHNDNYHRSSSHCRLRGLGIGLCLHSSEESASTTVHLLVGIDQWWLGTIRHRLSSLWQLDRKWRTSTNNEQ